MTLEQQAQKTINELYKHRELMSIMEDFNQAQYTPSHMLIKNSPRDKTDNAKTLTKFLVDAGFFEIYDGELTKKNIEDFAERLDRENLSKQEPSDEEIDVDELTNELVQNKIGNKLNIPNINPNRGNPLNNFSSFKNSMDYNQFSNQQLINHYNNRFGATLNLDEMLEDYGGDEDLIRDDLIKELKKDDNAKRIPISQASLKPWTNDNGEAKPGMNNLEKIVLKLCRDVERVKNAISPSGAEEIVKNHNKKSSSNAKWSLLKVNPQGPATLANMPDVNKDGVPDVIIKNAKGYPVYINGYTTKRSNYPETLAYYDAYPTRASRKGKSKAKFLRDELYNIEYLNEDDDTSNIGMQRAKNIPDWYNPVFASKKYKMTDLTKTKLNPFRRFQTYIVKPHFETLLESNKLEKFPAKGPLLAKVTGSLWNQYVVLPIAHAKQVPQSNIEKFKKSKEFNPIADAHVSELMSRLRKNEDESTQFDAEMSEIITNFLDSFRLNEEAINFLD